MENKLNMKLSFPFLLVQPGGASTEKIIEQVRKCPLGALSYVCNEGNTGEVDKVVAESASVLKIEVTKTQSSLKYLAVPAAIKMTPMIIIVTAQDTD